MNLSESWRVIGESIVPHASEPVVTAGASVGAARSAGMWHALFSDRARPLLLPAHNRKARQSGMRFFLPELWRKCYASLQLHAHDFLGTRARLPELTLPQTNAATLTDQLAFTESPQLAFLIGTPGPYQKVSILMMSPQGEPMALAKLALMVDANSMVKSEASWLRKLHAQPALRDFVPQLLSEGITRNGRQYFVQRVVRGRPSTGAFAPMHAAFLRQLGTIDQRVQRWSDAPIFTNLRRDLSRLAPLLSDEHKNLLDSAMQDCAARLADWRGPFVVGHGDFVAWNIRAADDRICVFDWEYATEGTSPLFDPFHFHLIAPAASGRLLSARDMKHALVTSRAFAQLTYPEFDWRMPVVAAHGLCYLVHTLVFYALSRGELVGTHPVVRSYCRLIQERAQWLQ